jgi:NAD(P)-dependent dehydrogenase (short-subunit alcohol dehydrogenase family)
VGQVAVVTGGAGGIGRAIAVELAAAGFSIVAVDVDEAGLQATVAAVDGEALAVVADVTTAEGAQSYVAAARDAFGSIDVLANNAGIEGAVAEIVDYPLDVFDRIVAVNLRGVFLGLKFVLPVMYSQGDGAVVNTASMAGMLGLAETSVYNATKAAVISLTKTAAAEAGPRGVRVNAICPGMIETRMFQSLVEGFNPDDQVAQRAAMTERVPLGRFGQPEEIARVVRFLASSDSSYVNGSAFLADGGVVATR